MLYYTMLCSAPLRSAPLRSALLCSAAVLHCVRCVFAHVVYYYHHYYYYYYYYLFIIINLLITIIYDYKHIDQGRGVLPPGQGGYPQVQGGPARRALPAPRVRSGLQATPPPPPSPARGSCQEYHIISCINHLICYYIIL